MNEIFEIRSDEIDVQELVRKIEKNIKERRKHGAYPDDIVDKLQEPLDTDAVADPEISRDLNFINANWNINNESYSISSHRPISGKFLVKGRQTVHGEVQRYVDPIVGLQAEFNACTARILNDLTREIDNSVRIVKNLEKSLEDLQSTIRSERESTLENLQSTIRSERESTLENLQSTIRSERESTLENLQSIIRSERESALEEAMNLIRSEMQEKIEAEVSNQLRSDFLSAMNKDIEEKAWLANILEQRIASCQPDSDNIVGRDVGLNYFIFSDEIGHSWEKIGGNSVNNPNVYQDSLQFFTNSKRVLDIGCGKGTFLRMLQANGISGYGIDINQDYVLHCEKFGLDVHLVDAITHLESLEDLSIDGVFMSQIAEHLSTGVLHEILRLCYEKMQSGAYIVITVPNILSMLVSTNLFYLDPTHHSHVHPEVLKYLLHSCGFMEIQEKFYQEIPEEIKLRRIESVDVADNERSDAVLDVLNSNIDQLNALLFGYRDYCGIAKK